MLASIRSEFRKLLTVRATWIFTIITFLITAFISFYSFGFNVTQNVDSPSHLLQPILLISLLSTFITIVAVLLVTNEYRYNTIMHTITLAQSRTQVLLAKIAVAAAYSLVATVLLVLMSIVLTKLGLNISGVSVVPQDLNLFDVLWRMSFYVVGNTLFAVLIAFIIRNQIGTIVFLLIGPSVITQIFTMILKDNARFLPLNALSSTLPTNGIIMQMPNALSDSDGALVFAAYMVVFTAVAWLMLAKRDAN